MNSTTHVQRRGQQQLTPDHRLLDPIEVPLDGSVPYRVNRDLLVPRSPGVYLVHDLRGVLYVGRTSELRRRFGEHYWQPTNPRLAAALAQPVGEQRFSWYLVAGPDQAALERHLIRFFQPLCNRLLYTAHTLAIDRRQRTGQDPDQHAMTTPRQPITTD